MRHIYLKLVFLSVLNLIFAGRSFAEPESCPLLAGEDSTAVELGANLLKVASLLPKIDAGCSDDIKKQLAALQSDPMVNDLANRPADRAGEAVPDALVNQLSSYRQLVVSLRDCIGNGDLHFKDFAINTLVRTSTLLAEYEPRTKLAADGVLGGAEFLGSALKRIFRDKTEVKPDGAMNVSQLYQILCAFGGAYARVNGCFATHLPFPFLKAIKRKDPGLTYAIGQVGNPDVTGMRNVTAILNAIQKLPGTTEELAGNPELSGLLNRLEKVLRKDIILPNQARVNLEKHLATAAAGIKNNASKAETSSETSTYLRVADRLAKIMEAQKAYEAAKLPGSKLSLDAAEDILVKTIRAEDSSDPKKKPNGRDKAAVGQLDQALAFYLGVVGDDPHQTVWQVLQEESKEKLGKEYQDWLQDRFNLKDAKILFSGETKSDENKSRGAASLAGAIDEMKPSIDKLVAQQIDFYNRKFFDAPPGIIKGDLRKLLEKPKDPYYAGKIYHKLVSRVAKRFQTSQPAEFAPASLAGQRAMFFDSTVLPLLNLCGRSLPTVVGQPQLEKICAPIFSCKGRGAFKMPEPGTNLADLQCTRWYDSEQAIENASQNFIDHGDVCGPLSTAAASSAAKAQVVNRHSSRLRK